MTAYKTGINIFMDVAGGKWKGLILYFLSQKSVRTKEFYQLIPGITQKVLTEQLKQLENDGLVRREVFKEIPPKVEYSLTELGESFIPVLNEMCDWGNKYVELKGMDRDQRIECEHN